MSNDFFGKGTVMPEISNQNANLAVYGYDRILVYGAGISGISLLGWLADNGFDEASVTVWDKKYSSLKNVRGFAVSKPDFQAPANGDNTLVILAPGTDTNFHAIEEIRKKFTAAGYKHFANADDVMGRRKAINRMPVNAFEDNARAGDLYQDDADFTGFAPPVKLIAFYLPQFHEIPENNEWWGEGFTEWTNTKRAGPIFKGHYQPREPHDAIGYYDLGEADTIRKQAELAKRHGIYGWGIYYYWFSGRKILTKPLDLICENKDIDINFFLLWCNEAWSKRWVGDDSQVLMDNAYTPDDPDKFIDDLKKYIEDERYIRIDGKPVIMVYLAHAIPDVKNVIKRWRERSIEIGVGEIAVLSAMRPSSIKELGLDDCFDGETEFCSTYYAIRGVQLFKDDLAISNYLYYYNSLVEEYKRKVATGDSTAYLSCICGFDNTPRYGERATICDLGFTLECFYNLVRFAVDDAVSYNKEFVFIFAWNEWAESAYLEPDKKYGYAMLNTFSKALFNLPIG